MPAHDFRYTLAYLDAEIARQASRRTRHEAGTYVSAAVAVAAGVLYFLYREAFGYDAAASGEEALSAGVSAAVTFTARAGIELVGVAALLMTVVHGALWSGAHTAYYQRVQRRTSLEAQAAQGTAARGSKPARGV
ncbi:hypothetical protein [Streptomyces vilmorinianum]|uniref:hypothetical protein n=1 Tax=Streptomyces vilmorinianum TaxID=3051092 RepID=UPI0010FBA9EC|nr:hypothetical protein [Streptomyces vilmorinianum]